MVDSSSNQFWENTQNYKSFELRAHRFRNEMLPVFYKWLGISPESIILDGGCGTGVFTRYLANNLTCGHITGFDINKTFIEYGNQKAMELSLSDKMKLEIADGFHLTYADNKFDAVTNYTYIGVLSDPEAGMRELIRVCKPQGIVSCVIATNSLPYVGSQGSYPFDEDGELQRLSTIENKIFSDINKLSTNNSQRELILFKKLGLKEIHMYPFSHLICYNDTNFSLEYRKQLAIDETEEEINWLSSRYSDKKEIYAKYGFSQNDYEKLMELLKMKYEYLTRNFDIDYSYEWHGGYNYIITGIKD